MKKQIIATCVALGLSVMAGAAFAAPAAFQNNEEVTGGVGGECSLLSRSVTLGVSAKVHGAYDCDEAANLVKVAACHEGGSRSGVTCVAIQVLDAQGAPVAGSFTYPAGCDATSAAAGTQSPIPSYKSFFASSAGGVMIEYPLDGRCASGTLMGIEGF